MENNYELSDELLDSISGGARVEDLNEEDRVYYEEIVRPALDGLREAFNTCSAEQRHMVKSTMSDFVEMYTNILVNGRSEALKQLVVPELWDIVLS